jgi:hypothetical protein
MGQMPMAALARLLGEAQHYLAIELPQAMLLPTYSWERDVAKVVHIASHGDDQWPAGHWCPKFQLTESSASRVLEAFDGRDYGVWSAWPGDLAMPGCPWITIVIRSCAPCLGQRSVILRLEGDPNYQPSVPAAPLGGFAGRANTLDRLAFILGAGARPPGRAPDGPGRGRRQRRRG